MQKTFDSAFKRMLRRVQHRNFSLTYCFFKQEKSETNPCKIISNANDTTTEIDRSCLQPVPKKTYGLSKVEEKDVELVESLKKGNLLYPYKSPYERCAKILGNEMKRTLRKMFYHLSGVKLGPLEPVYFPRYTDILIIGGGILGLTIAYSIKEKFPHGLEVMVVDKDCNFPPLSTNLSQGLLTYQLFTDEEEIPMLKYGAEFFSSFSKKTKVQELPGFKLSYEPLGSMLLVDNSNAEKLLMKTDLLKKYEIHNKVVDNKTLKEKFPWLNSSGILFGSLGMSDEGVIDPWGYMFGIKSKCLSLGVTFVTAEVIDFGYNDNTPFRVACKLPDGSYNSIDFSRCVLTCGMEALNLTEMLNSSDKMEFVVKLPLKEKMKYEFCFYNPEGPGLNIPIVINSDGTYLRREGLCGHYVAGVSGVPFNDDEENDPYYIFQNKVKPFAMERIPSFKNLQVIKGWADLQEDCYSNNIGILGCHPQAWNIFFALGFSHLGLQYMPAVARAAMETIVYEEYQTIDFTSLHLENLWKKQHLEAEKQKKNLLESKKRIAISD